MWVWLKDARSSAIFWWLAIRCLSLDECLQMFYLHHPLYMQHSPLHKRLRQAYSWTVTCNKASIICKSPTEPRTSVWGTRAGGGCVTGNISAISLVMAFKGAQLRPEGGRPPVGGCRPRGRLTQITLSDLLRAGTYSSTRSSTLRVNHTSLCVAVEHTSRSLCHHMSWNTKVLLDSGGYPCTDHLGCMVCRGCRSLMAANVN